MKFIPAWGEFGLRLAHPEFVPLIPSDQWARWLAVARALHESRGHEVGALLLRPLGGGSDPLPWRIVVPRQQAGPAACRYAGVGVDTPGVCLVTGETLPVAVPSGWAVSGTTHSHHAMRAFFSSTDEQDEKDIVGYHVVIGGFPEKRRADWSYEFRHAFVAPDKSRWTSEDDVPSLVPSAGPADAADPAVRAAAAMVGEYPAITVTRFPGGPGVSLGWSLDDDWGWLTTPSPSEGERRAGKRKRGRRYSDDDDQLADDLVEALISWPMWTERGRELRRCLRAGLRASEGE